jgi:hypothetical protein
VLHIDCHASTLGRKAFKRIEEIFAKYPITA